MTRSAQSATIARPSVRHDAIGARRNNRWTFGAAQRDWRKAQQSLDLRFAHKCYRYLGVRLPDAIGAERSDRWTSRFGTQIVAALRLRFRLRKIVRRVQARPRGVCISPSPGKCKTHLNVPPKVRSIKESGRMPAFSCYLFRGFSLVCQCLASSGCGPRRPIEETASRAARSSASREKENTSAFSTMREGVADLGRGRTSCSRQ